MDHIERYIPEQETRLRDLEAQTAYLLEKVLSLMQKVEGLERVVEQLRGA